MAGNYRYVKRSAVRPSFDRRPPRRQKTSLSLPAAWIRRSAVGLVVLMVLIVLSRWTALKSISVSGNSAVPQQRITGLAEESLRLQFFGRNTALADSAAVENYLEKAEPALKNVTVKKRLPGKLEIIVQERQPGLNWKTGETVYLLDVDGTVIGPTKGLYSRLPVIIDSSNVPVKPGQQAVPTGFITFCTVFLGNLTPATGLKAGEITVGQSTSELYVKTDRGFTLKLDTTRPAGDEIADLKAVMKELARAKKSPAQYIDLRVENKAYYK